MRSRIRRQCYYDARVNDVNLEEITSSEKNANILRSLRDEGIIEEIYLTEVIDREGNFFVIREGDDLGWLGYFLGESKYLGMLAIISLPEERERIDALMEGIARNKSTQTLIIATDALGDFIDPMSQLIGNSSNLSRISFIRMNIERQQAQNIVSALRQVQCNPMNLISLSSNFISEEGLEAICRELASPSQIEVFDLDLEDSNIGRHGCLTLGSMLSSWHAPKMEDLNLQDNSIDDRGLQALVAGMINCCNLEIVKLSGNRSITAAGLSSLSTLFQSENCSLEDIYLERMNIGDDGAAVLAEGLVGNTSLMQLHFSVDMSGITEVGWSAFSKLLCDTSSINNTYLSNHTLKWIGESDDRGAPKDVKSYLDVNCHRNKRDVAILKIFGRQLEHQHQFDTESLFRWTSKFLPLVVRWFERARSASSVLAKALDEEEMDEVLEALETMKLSAVHEFVRGMPMLIIDGYNSRRTNTRMSRKRRLDGETK